VADNDQTSRTNYGAMALALAVCLLAGLLLGLLFDRIGTYLVLGLCAGAVVAGIQFARRPRHGHDSDT
jgi:hypothetical protein